MADKSAFDYVNEIWSIANYVRDVIAPPTITSSSCPSQS